MFIIEIEDGTKRPKSLVIIISHFLARNTYSKTQKPQWKRKTTV